MEKKHSKSWIIHIICILAILGIFAISSLLLVNVGVQVYKNIVLNNTENFKLRTSLSFVATKIRQFDEKDAITVEERQGTPVLVLKEEVDGIVYHTMIYFYEGKLCELYQEEGAEQELSYGQEVTEINEFIIEQPKDNLVKLTAKDIDGETESLYVNIQTAN